MNYCHSKKTPAVRPGGSLSSFARSKGGGLKTIIIHQFFDMLNVEQFTLADYKDIPVEITVWNRLPDMPAPVLCIDYHHVADAHSIRTLREQSGFRYEPHAIVSLMYSHGTNWEALREYAQRTGQITVGIVFTPPHSLRREQKTAVRGLKHRVVNHLGWGSTVACALDDKPALWWPHGAVTSLHLDDAKVTVHKIRLEAPSSSVVFSSPPVVPPSLPDPGAYSLTLIVRKDLNMQAGKVAAQCVHAALGACHQNRTSPLVLAYCNASYERRCVTLKVNNAAEMEAVRDKAVAAGLNVYMQIDAGLTQVPVNSATVLALGPDDPERIRTVTEALKLY